MIEKLNESEIGKGSEKTVTHPASTETAEEKHAISIEAPKSVIAGEPLEVIVTVVGIPGKTYPQSHLEKVELYLDSKLIGKSVMTPLKDEEMVSIFRIGDKEALLAIKEIETSGVNEINTGGSFPEKSVITNLCARVTCNIHGVSEAKREIEVLPKKLKEIEDAENVFVKPEDRKDYIGNGP